VLVEKAEFPRFHIGESLTGECAKCLDALGLSQLLVENGNPVKYGVRVYGPSGKDAFWIPVMSRDAEGKLVQGTTWQVKREPFDTALLERAKEAGVEVHRGEAVGVDRDGERITGVRIRDLSGSERVLPAQVVLDASGMASFLCSAGVVGPKQRSRYDKQVAFFGQVRGGKRAEGTSAGDTLIFYQKPHHWGWFIPLDDELVSVGVVVPSETFAARRQSKQAFFEEEMRKLNPELTRRLASAERVGEVRSASNYSYDIPRYTGKNFLCVGDAHRFIDPIFSFGLYFAIKEAQFAAEAIEGFLSGKGAALENPFADYEERCTRGMDAIQTLVDAFWSRPLAFAVYAHDRYRDDTIDLFAGRVYSPTRSPGLEAMIALVEEEERATG
jgi:FADH2-dependent halogenase